MKIETQMPKTFLCKECGKKPRREIVSWSYGDSNDELFLVHTCKNGPMRFPEKDRFLSYRIPSQQYYVVNAWNEEKGKP